jgi:hypothetical protein
MSGRGCADAERYITRRRSSRLGSSCGLPSRSDDGPRTDERLRRCIADSSACFLVPVRVAFIPWVAVPAVGSTFGCSSVVLGRCHGFQVLESDTGTVVAGVIDGHPLGNVAVGELIGDSVCAAGFPLEVEAAVAIGVEVAGVLPAVLVHGDLREKPSGVAVGRFGSGCRMVTHDFLHVGVVACYEEVMSLFEGRSRQCQHRHVEKLPLPRARE